MPSFRVAILIAFLGGCSRQPLVPTISLRPADALLPVEFSYVGSIRELADHRVLVADEKENRLAVADSGLTRITDIGRIGDGPGEFHTLAMLWALGGDSTLMPERGRHRWLLLDGARPVATMPMGHPAVGAFYLGYVVGASRSGDLVGVSFPHDDRHSLPDSVFLVRTSLSGDRIDTIARLASGMSNAESSAGDAGGGSPSGNPHYMMGGLRGADFATAFPDGVIAIVRTDPYRVDWCALPARCRAGPILEPTVSFSPARKVAYLAFAAKTHRWPPTIRVDETVDWPERVAPVLSPSNAYDASGLTPLPDGRLLVERASTFDASATSYDLIARDGSRVGRLVLPGDLRVVGVGTNALYIVRTDENDVQHIERHPWP